MNQPLPMEAWYNKTWLVILLCLFVFPVGVYALWKSSKIGNGWKIGVTVIVGLMVVAAFTSPEKQPKPEDEIEAAVREAEQGNIKEEDPQPTIIAEASHTSNTSATETKKAIFETPEDFRVAFNNASSKTKLDYEIDDLQVSDGEVQNTFNATLNRNLALLGTVNKETGKVLDVMMIGTGDGSFKSGSDIFLCMATVIATVDPQLPPKERGEILKDLGLLGGKENVLDLNEKTERNGIKYFVSSSELTGIMFGASRN